MSARLSEAGGAHRWRRTVMSMSRARRDTVWEESRTSGLKAATLVTRMRVCSHSCGARAMGGCEDSRATAA